MSSHHNSNKGSFNTNQQFVTPMGNNKNNPQKIHVAHRRSPSELTNLMIEQLNIGNENRSNESRSNEGRSNYHNSQNPSPFLPPPPLQGNANNNNNNNNYYHYSGHSNSNSNAGSRGHSRNNSYGNAQNSNGGGGSDTHYHKRKSDSQSSIVLQPPQSSSSSSAQQGHSRRHSLGLNEAKKAAAEEQMKRQGQMSGHNTPPHSSTSSGLSSGVTTSSTLSQPPVVQAHGNGLNHSRNNSLNAFTSPNKSFQFPAKPPSFGNSNSNGNDNDENSGQDYHYAYSPRKFQQSHSRNNSGYNSGSTGGSGGGYANNNNNNNNNNQHYSHKNQNSHSGQQSLLLEPLQTHHHHYNNSNSSNFHKHSMSNSNSNSNSNANPQSQRKSLFAPYLPQANIPQLLQEGKLVLGTLRVNKKNRSDAWVSTDGVLDADIFICGSKDRNRALENDLVAVELLCVDDVWGSKKEKEEKKRRKDQGSVQQDLLNSGEDYHNDATVLSPRKDSTKRSSFIDEPVIPSAGNSNLANFNNDNNNNAKTHENDFKNDSDQQQGLKRRGSLKQRPTQKKNDDVEVEGQSLLLVEEEEINDDFKPLYAGHIVAVLDRIPGQLFSGTLGLLRPSQSSSSNSSENNNNKDNNNNNNNNNNEHVRKPKIVWFKPTDKKVPLVAIPTEQAPEDFVTNSENYANKLFIASIKRWPITSLHPFGTLVEQLGEINESATEVEAILKNNNFESNEYLDPQNRSREKPIFKPYPFQSDTTQRPVYQSPNIHTIKQSLNGPHDMALQVEHFAPGGSNAGAEIVRFSVHVVDVTEHIENGSSLDRRARKRSTGVYLPQKTVYLLPQKVNSELSLTKGSKATTLSVHYDIDLSNGKILGQKIEESFIVPDGESIGEEELEIAPNAKTAAPTAHFIESIQKIASLFNQLRMNNSKNSITPRLSLLETLDDEKIKISDLNYYFNENGYIMKEIHFKVNNTVAEFNYSKLGDQAFLRRHAEPLSTKFQYFLHRISEFNQFDTVLNLGNPELCLKSISKIEDNHLRKCIEILFYKTLNRSKYYIAGKVDPDQFGHYLLNYPIYTHFTCPFKRYADHVVHKQLKAVLKNQVDSFNAGNDIDSLKITAEYCNFKKDCAFAAQEQSIHLLLCKTINDMCKNSNNMDQVLTLGLVIQVYESSFDVYLPEFGIEKRVHGDQLPVTKAEFDNINKVLELYWNPSIDSATFIPNDEKKPNSYRSSIKNNFKSSSHNIAKTELRKIPELSQELQKTFQDWHLEPPTLSLLSKLTTKSSSLPETSGSASSPLNVFKNYTTTRIEGDLEKSHVQEIRELDYVPILVRAEIGMALPCLSVRALNPFLE